MLPTSVDLALQRMTPVEVVPFQGNFEAMQEVGHRFLVARDGLWIEARRPWIHVIWPLAQQTGVRMPFGGLERTVRMPMAAEVNGLVQEFMGSAEAAHPNEVGAVGVWNAKSGETRLAATRAIHSGVGHLTYERPALGDDEHVVLDVHSHGPIEAYFSDVDLADTGAEVVVAAVVGGIGRALEVKVSLFVCGLQIPMRWKPMELGNMQGQG